VTFYNFVECEAFLLLFKTTYEEDAPGIETVCRKVYDSTMYSYFVANLYSVEETIYLNERESGSDSRGKNPSLKGLKIWIVSKKGNAQEISCTLIFKQKMSLQDKA